MSKASLIDDDLLNDFRSDRSPAKFAEIVRQSTDLVYSAAMRQVGDPALAEDVTQIVFLTLWHKAGTIRESAALPAWLLRATHYTALNVLRQEYHRRAREREVAKMRIETHSPAESKWNDISPLIDEALDRLGERDRRAVVLRYFIGRSFAEVGKAVGISEEAARKRISRAIDRMRAFLADRGLRVPSDVLSGLIVAEAVRPAPTGIASSIATTQAAGGTTASIASSVGRRMTWIAAKPMVVTAATLIVSASIAAIVMQIQAPASPDFQTLIPTIKPATTTTRYAGVARLPNGAPAAGAKVGIGWGVALTASSANDQLPRLSSSPEFTTTTDRDGRFSLPLPPRPDAKAVVVWPLAIVAMHDSGVGWSTPDDRAGESTIDMHPWSSVEGSLSPSLRNGQPQTITAKGRFGGGGYFESEIMSDRDGNFRILHVPPMELEVGRYLRLGKSLRSRDQVRIITVPVDSPAKVVLGEAGTNVTGKALLPAGATYGIREIIAYAHLVSTAIMDRQHASESWHAAPVNEDGSFTVLNVEPGEYWVGVSLISRDNEQTGHIEHLARFGKKMVIPKSTEGAHGVKDLGPLQLESLPRKQMRKN